MKKIISLILSGIILITGVVMAPSVFAGTITLSKTKVSVKQFEQVNIDFTADHVNSQLLFEYDNQNAEAADMGVRNRDPESNKIGIIGLKPGKTKITIYLPKSSNRKVKIGTIDVTVSKNSRQSQVLKKALRKSITVKKGCTTDICVFKKSMTMDNCRAVVSAGKNAKAVNIPRYPQPFAKTPIKGKNLGKATAKVYIAPRFILKTSNDTIRIHAKSKIYIGKININVVKSKKSTLKESKHTLDYQEESVRKILSLNADDWKYTSAEIKQKIYLKDLVNTYDKKSTYTLTSSNKNIIATGKNSNGIYIWAKKAGNADVTIYQKEPDRKKAKIGKVRISTGKVITLADVANAWDSGYDLDDHAVHYKSKTMWVLEALKNDENFKDTYTAEYISNYPEYLAVNENGEITWFGYPRIQESGAKPLVTAKLTFIDGSEFTMNFKLYVE